MRFLIKYEFIYDRLTALSSCEGLFDPQQIVIQPSVDHGPELLENRLKFALAIVCRLPNRLAVGRHLPHKHWFATIRIDTDNVQAIEPMRFLQPLPNHSKVRLFRREMPVPVCVLITLDQQPKRAEAKHHVGSSEQLTRFHSKVMPEIARL